MSQFTIEDLKRIMRECAGEDDAFALAGDVRGVPFEDLGYDSLALMETASRIEREYGVGLPEDEIADIVTPGALVDFVNGRVGQVA